MATTTNEIIVLNEGYSYMEKDDDSVMVANCTCTLIKSHDCNIIVDTMTPWDGDLLLQRLQESCLSTDDIDWVVSTHGHSDHLGNNNLFLKAKHIVGTNISQRNRYFIHDFSIAPYRLSDTIEIVETPGHTLSCVSVLVRSSQLGPTGLVAIVGDLFERRQDIDDERLWLDAGSENPTVQRQNRAKIAAISDLIIPGHGAPFPVDQQLKNCLMTQLQEQSHISVPQSSD
ncbi:metallo-beta-lactamase domain-containing protein 1 isoform X1 [Wyeomyia smithii]|uniref:metallo-beta-lactamase domain-containing protein 1 isoform X1 n=1 Tax=Wyeomyia smithii TaxID=174621 RepID=UPI00246802DF|nr:metallo-beta-lactamase domain-containing protein 1 isoform X1 [Wyeomyia smithii]